MLQSKHRLDKESNQFKEANAAVVALIKRAIEEIAVKRYHYGQQRGPSHLKIRWPGSSIAWHANYPKHCTKNMGTDAMANANEACAVIALGEPWLIHLIIGPNGAWSRPRNEDGWIVGESEHADAELVTATLDVAFKLLAKDLAERSMAGVAQELRAKSVGFSRFKKIVDIAKEVLGK